MTKRYFKQHEFGNDYAVIEISDRGNITIASGLDESEADETIASREKEEDARRTGRSDF